LNSGEKAGIQLIMPRLGEPTEPAHARRPESWWRAVDTIAPAAARESSVRLPKSMSWPID
jgi:hypothetical protein